MRKIILIVTAVLATTSAHAELSGATVAAAAAPATQAAPAVTQPAPAPVQAAPVQPIIQTTNPQAQRVLKELQAHGLIKLQPQPVAQPAPAAPANVVAAPTQVNQTVNQTQTVQAPAVQPQAVQTQPVQPQAAQTQPVQAQTIQPQPVAAASQQPATQPAAAPATPSGSVSKPVVHATTHRDADEAKARRIAARYGVHW